MRYSIVTTLYRSGPFLNEFYDRITATVRQITEDYEIIFVNDGSPDDSLETVLELHRKDPHVTVVDLSRNFGHLEAILTGLRESSGDLVYLIDCDLEEPPELLQEFNTRLLDEKVDVVFGVQEKRKGGISERFTGFLFYSLFNLLSYHPIPRNLVTVRLMNRKYVDSLLLFEEREVCLSGLWATTGFNQVEQPIKKGSRGESTYTLAKKISHFANAITSFSNKPLYFIFYLGLGTAMTGFLAVVYVLVSRLIFGQLYSGWASLAISIWVIGGLNILSIGIVGIYLAKVFVETKRRPLTIIRETYKH